MDGDVDGDVDGVGAAELAILHRELHELEAAAAAVDGGVGSGVGSGVGGGVGGGLGGEGGARPGSAARVESAEGAPDDAMWLGCAALHAHCMRTACAHARRTARAMHAPHVHCMASARLPHGFCMRAAVTRPGSISWRISASWTGSLRGSTRGSSRGERQRCASRGAACLSSTRSCRRAYGIYIYTHSEYTHI